MIETIITSSVLIIMIIAVRRILKGRISLRLQYALWALVAIRLLLPFSLFASPFSMMNAVDIKQVQSAVLSYSVPVPSFDSFNLDAQKYAEETSIPLEKIWDSDLDAAASQWMTISIMDLLLLIWICGVGCTAICLIAANINFYYRLKKRAVLVEVPDCPLPVYCAEGLPSPCLFGIVRPSIYLTPESLAGEERLRHILAHELTHYIHKDHLWAFIRVICIAIYWFNPLVWVAAVLSRRDCELACDESTILRLGEDSRMEYGRTLITMMTSRSSPIDLLYGATTMASGKNGIKERVSLIANKPKMLMVTLIAVILLAIAATAFTFTGAKTDGPDLSIVLPTLDASVSKAILAHNAGHDREDEFKTESHVTLKTIENESTAVVYLIAYYAVYDFPDGKPALVSGSHLPVSLTFSKDESGAYTLTDYWESSDGSEYASSIKEKFPADISEQAISTQLYAEQQQAATIKKAKEYIRQQQGA